MCGCIELTGEGRACTPVDLTKTQDSLINWWLKSMEKKEVIIFLLINP